MQIVYISNRPEVLLGTLSHVALFMPFIDQAIACVPDSLVHQFEDENQGLPLKLIPESAVLTPAERKSLVHLDHSKRNYLLRIRLISQVDIGNQFIMSDDDARPLKMISLDYYLEEGRYHRYYFYDLRRWSNNQTAFDVCQLSTCAVLEYNNLSTLSYASHMPQIIDRKLFLESVNFFKQQELDYPFCEWTSYFNYAATKNTEMFHSPKAYSTLCWPEHPLAWKQYVQQSDYVFENFTPLCYQQNQPFSGLNVLVDGQQSIVNHNIEKLLRWRQYSIECFQPEQSKGLLKYFKLRTWINKLLKHLIA